MQTIPLLSLVITFLSLSHTCQAVNFLANRTWMNTLANDQELNVFLTGSHRMVRETIVFSLANNTVVMGSDPMGTLKLSDCLDTIRRHRKEHGVVLIIPGVKIYDLAYPTLESFANNSWITLSFAIARGPNGVLPKISSLQLNKIVHTSTWPRMMRVSVGMTTSDLGPEKGYSAFQLVQLVQAVVSVPNLRTAMVLDLFLDGYHISHTVGTEAFPMIGKVGRILFSVSPDMQNKLNFDGFMYVYARMSKDRTFLNMPRPLQMRILESKKNQEEVTNGSIDRGGFFFTMSLALVFMYFLVIY